MHVIMQHREEQKQLKEVNSIGLPVQRGALMKIMLIVRYPFAIYAAVDTSLEVFSESGSVMRAVLTFVGIVA